MERSSSSKSSEDDKAGIVSCWGRLKLKVQRSRISFCLRDMFTKKRRVKMVNFRYDPLSYSQNFDEGGLMEEEMQNSFSSRYAALSSKPAQPDRQEQVL